MNADDLSEGRRVDTSNSGLPETPPADSIATSRPAPGRISRLRRRIADQCRREPIALAAAFIGIAAILFTIFQWKADPVTRMEQRAWINLSFSENARGSTGSLAQGIEVTNSGKTPAYKINGASATLLLNKYYVPDFGDETLFTPLRQSQPLDVMFPSQSTTWNSPVSNHKVTPADIGDIATGRKFLVTYGRLTYHDMFGDEHELRFCEVRPEGGPEWIGSQQCDRYNRSN